MPLYRIHHGTTYRHGSPAAVAWQSLRLRPRDESAQACLEFDLELSPSPADLTTRADFFGNTQHVFTVREVHHEFSIDARSLVRRGAPALPVATATPPAAAGADLTADAVLAGDFNLEQYRHATPLVPALAGAADLARSVDSSLPLLDWMQALGLVFARSFRFDPAATLVSTPLAEVLKLRRGVCQDFAHLYLACARSLGLPAAYVSGYLLTHPLPGQPRLAGADAMHAWISVYIPGTGWIDYDPTNHCFVGDSHIVVARGRDYADVSPTRGVFSGGGAHALFLGVTVEPAEPAPAA